MNGLYSAPPRSAGKMFEWLPLSVFASPAALGMLNWRAYASETLEPWLTTDDVGGASHVPPPPWAAVGSPADLRGGP
jgi:hypothetical protein